MSLSINREYFINAYLVLVVLLLIVSTELLKWFKESLQCDNVNPFVAVDPVVLGGILQSSHGASVLILFALILFFTSASKIKNSLLVLGIIVLLPLTVSQYQSGSRSIEKIISPDAQQYNEWVCARRDD